MAELKIINLEVEGSNPAKIKSSNNDNNSVSIINKPRTRKQEMKCRVQKDSIEGHEIKNSSNFVPPTIDQLRALINFNNVSSVESNQKMKDSTSKMATKSSQGRGDRLQNLAPNFNYSTRNQSQLKEKVKPPKRYLKCDHVDPESQICVIKYYNDLEKSKRAKKATSGQRVKVPWCLRRIWANAELERRGHFSKKN